MKKIILSNRFLTFIAVTLNKFLLKRKYKLKLGRNVFLGFSVVLEGRNYFADSTSITNSFIGYGSYLGAETRLSKIKVGRYCSIGPRVNCVFGKHPTDTFVSTHPVFYSNTGQMGFSYTDKPLFNEYAENIDEDNKYSIVIGNDVWIGANVTIMDGVKIGDGAIVASNALVSTDVEPYSIVGGLPAKNIKKRFSEEKIDFLMQLKWWEKEVSWIRENAPLFLNVDELFNKYSNG